MVPTTTLTNIVTTGSTERSNFSNRITTTVVQVVDRSRWCTPMALFRSGGRAGGQGGTPTSPRMPLLLR